jgi:iron complex outermembrane receptor protein
MTTETAATVPVYGLYKAEPTLPDLNHFSGWGTSVQVHWSNPISEVVSITAVRGENYVQSFDLSDTPGGLKLTRPAFEQRQTTQEFQFNSKWDGPLSLTSGIFYFYEHAYEELDLIIDPATTLPYESGQDSRSFAVYSELTYAIQPSLKLSLGGRETWDRKSIVWGGIYDGISGAQPYRDFTPHALLSWQATPDFMTYASYSKGYAAGRYQAFPGSASVAAVSTPPQFVTAYEVGIKSQWLQRRVTANLAVFDNKYTDLGVNVNGTGNLIQVLSADSVARGAELEVSVRPFSQLTLNGQVSRLFTRYTRTPDVAGGPNVGDEMRYSPPWSGAANGDYRVPFAASRNVVLGAGAIWSDTNPTTGVPNAPFFFQRPYWLFNARLGIEDTSKNWLVELAGQNLSNTAWFDTASVLSGGVRWYNPPRTWSLRVKLSL